MLLFVVLVLKGSSAAKFETFLVFITWPLLSNLMMIYSSQNWRLAVSVVISKTCQTSLVIGHIRMNDNNYLYGKQFK